MLGSEQVQRLLEYRGPAQVRTETGGRAFMRRGDHSDCVLHAAPVLHVMECRIDLLKTLLCSESVGAPLFHRVLAAAGILLSQHVHAASRMKSHTRMLLTLVTGAQSECLTLIKILYSALCTQPCGMHNGD